MHTRDGGGGSAWHVIYVSGMSADLSDPLIRDFQARLERYGFASSSVVDYWASYPYCQGPCKADVQIGEWLGEKTGVSTAFSETLGAEITVQQAQGKKVVVVGHSMGGTMVMNASLVLADQGVQADAIVLMGGAVRQEVKEAIGGKGISLSEVVNPCDKVPEKAASGSWFDALGLARAGNDANCHQLPGYFSPSNIDSTLNGVGKVRIRGEGI